MFFMIQCHPRVEILRKKRQERKKQIDINHTQEGIGRGQSLRVRVWANKGTASGGGTRKHGRKVKR
jgi:hypothetical protein